MEDILATLDSKKKVRIIYISCEFNEDDNAYTILRKSGIFKGKLITQPSIIISSGKVKRTLKEQAELEYKSLVKKYLDKGYIKILDDTVSEEDIKNLLPTTKQDTTGALKPMLCKVLDKSDKKLTDKTYYASYKLDGVRCALFIKDGIIKTASRGGQNYDIPATFIRNDEFVIKFFKENPEIILDGEIYRHGWPLNKISGLCRKETLENLHNQLEFRCYDIVDESKTFTERFKLLNLIKESCPKESKLKIVDHFIVKGLDQIMSLHDKAVSEGYEGLVIRDPDKTYKCGGRDTRMMKIKEMQDSEFEIIGISEGLRDEDLCFILKTSEGYQFKAKPIGTRDDKQWYREHIDDLIGKLGTVKYFGMTNTDKPVPNLPVFKTYRSEEDL